MTDLEPEFCEVCGNHAVIDRKVEEAFLRECEFCGNLTGPSDVVELLELQREADRMGVSEYSYPLAQFVEQLPGVRLTGDSGGDIDLATMPYVGFELSDHRTWQLENIGQGMRLMRTELRREWVLEFTYDFQLGFELHTRADGRTKHTATEIEDAQADLVMIWRRLQAFKGLSWWKHE
ncbi:hypothetical protein OAU50_04370 [Planctomycetota bacterium]|nr:hypothetical protein [Planctomycetota bacterium]